LEAKTRARFERYEVIKKEEVRFEAEGFNTGGGEFTGEGPDLTIVAYGTAARVALGARHLAEKEGVKLGLFRPITLWPFPHKALGKLASTGKPILTVEMSMGQLVEDVKLAVLDADPKAPRSAVHLLGHSGGALPTEGEVFARVKAILADKV
jgi:2-oxoglutarate ferredoxin oxidoreductase subunit alpha